MASSAIILVTGAWLLVVVAGGWWAGWLDGWMGGWQDGWLTGWWAGWLDGWMAGRVKDFWFRHACVHSPMHAHMYVMWVPSAIP